MELENYNLNVLLLAAIRSEIDSKSVYETLANRVKNSVLKDRLLFLAGEEEKHRAYLESLYRQRFPDSELDIPNKSPVPLPEVDASEERLLSEIIEDSMKAELAAEEFYKSLCDLFPDSKEVQKMLTILAEMEHGHYILLEKELENLKNFEDYDTYWPMMHSGP